MNSLDNYKFNTIGDQRQGRGFLGYISSVDKTSVSELAMVRGSKNIYKKLSGNYAAREGLKLRGTADTTQAPVVAEFVWNTSLAGTRVLRVVNYGTAIAKLQIESDVLVSGTYVWYDLMVTLSLTRFVFDTWWNNTLKKDELVFVKGDTNMHMWQGGLALFVSYAATVITLDRNAALAGFASTGGSVVIGANTYTYAGISGSTLTGTADASAVIANSVVLSAVVTTANTPASTFTNDYLKTIGNRVHVGSYTSRQVYISDDSDYTSYSVPATRAPGDPEIITMDSSGKGIGVKDGNAHLFAGDSDLYIVSYTPVTVGSTLTEQTKVDHRVLSGLESSLAHEFIANIGDDLLWLTQKNQLKIFATFHNLNTPSFPSLSWPVQNELKEIDFTGGHVKSVGEDLFITSPLTGTVYWFVSRTSVTMDGIINTERFWNSPMVWNGSRVASIAGVSYIYSNANPQLYRMFDTMQWHDDSPSGEALPYDAIMAMAYRGKRGAYNAFNKTYFEGYASPGTQLKALVLYDYQGSTNTVSLVINSNDVPAVFLGEGIGASLGDFSLGDNPLGDGITTAIDDQETLPKFRAIRGVTDEDCFEYQLVVFSDQLDSRWEMSCLGTNVVESDNYPTHLQDQFVAIT